MELQQLSFADIMAKYVENPVLTTFTGSNSITLVENSDLPVFKKTCIMTCEPNYNTYTNVANTSSKSTNWLKIIILLIIILGGGLLIYYYREPIRKWYAKHFESWEEDDVLV